MPLERIKPDQIAMVADFKAMETVQMGAGIGVLLTRFMKSDQTLIHCIELPEYLGTVRLIPYRLPPTGGRFHQILRRDTAYETTKGRI
jgi:hypothetical protein